MASESFVAAIEHFKIVNPKIVPHLEDFAQTFRASSIVQDAATGSKLRAGAASGGKGRGGTFTARNKRWRLLFDGIVAKFPDKNDSEIARILKKAIALANQRPDAPDDQTGRTPNHRTLRRLVGEWRKEVQA